MRILWRFRGLSRRYQGVRAQPWRSVRVALYPLPAGALAPVFDGLRRGPIYEQIAE
jgi:hypothetical protein